MTFQLPSKDYPRLPRSWKNRYPFRLACPSFVYPADYDINVELLGPYVDEIELLFFESLPACRPGEGLITKLVNLGQIHEVGYHAHLPTDLTLFDEDPARQQAAATTLMDLLHALAPLAPAFFVLHLEMTVAQKNTPCDRHHWEKCVVAGLDLLSTAGCAMTSLRVENQSVPLEWLEPVLRAFDLTLCLDIGHLKLAGERLDRTLGRWHPQISALHVHGVAGGKDHRALTCLSASDQSALAAYLRSFRGSVSVEIFNFRGLCESLQLIETWLD